MNPPELYTLAFLASFFYIGLKSWQQSNVTHKKYWWILPTSLLMAGLEVYTVSIMAKHGVGILVFIIGFGGGLGSITFTYLHDKLVMKNKEEIA